MPTTTATTSLDLSPDCALVRRFGPIECRLGWSLDAGNAWSASLLPRVLKQLAVTSHRPPSVLRWGAQVRNQRSCLRCLRRPLLCCPLVRLPRNAKVERAERPADTGWEHLCIGSSFELNRKGLMLRASTASREKRKDRVGGKLGSALRSSTTPAFVSSGMARTAYRSICTRVFR